LLRRGELCRLRQLHIQRQTPSATGKRQVVRDADGRTPSTNDRFSRASRTAAAPVNDSSPPFVSTKLSARHGSHGSRYRHESDASSMPACVGGRDT
jgi:hypothetical protein